METRGTEGRRVEDYIKCYLKFVTQLKKFTFKSCSFYELVFKRHSNMCGILQRSKTNVRLPNENTVFITFIQ